MRNRDAEAGVSSRSVPLLSQSTHSSLPKGGFCLKTGSLRQDALQRASAQGSSLDVADVPCSSRGEDVRKSGNLI